MFTDAHQTCGLGPYLQYMSKLTQKIKKINKVIIKCCNENNLEGCFTAIMAIDGVGKFIAWQVICDLMESQCLKPCTENDWTKLGPGANGKQCCPKN